jgi:hypothetical protein
MLTSRLIRARCDAVHACIVIVVLWPGGGTHRHIPCVCIAHLSRRCARHLSLSLARFAEIKTDAREVAKELGGIRTNGRV